MGQLRRDGMVTELKKCRLALMRAVKAIAKKGSANQKPGMWGHTENAERNLKLTMDKAVDTFGEKLGKQLIQQSEMKADLEGQKEMQEISKEMAMTRTMRDLEQGRENLQTQGHWDGKHAPRKFARSEPTWYDRILSYLIIDF